MNTVQYMGCFRQVLIAAIMVSLPCFAKIITWPAPLGSPVSTERYAVSVRQAGGAWQQVDVYDFFDQYTHGHSLTAETFIALFDTDTTVEVQIRVNETWHSVSDHIARPQHTDFASSRNGQNIMLTLTPANNKVMVEVNGEARKGLLICANPIDTRIPESDTGRIETDDYIYFGPGYYQEDIKTQKNVWLCGGAVLEGSIVLRNTSQKVIRGSGIIYSPEKQAKVPLKTDLNQMVHIENITIASRTDQWNFWIHASDNVTVNNVKMLGEVRDGIGIINSQFVTIYDSYIQSQDDCITHYGLRWSDEPVEHTLIQSCITNNPGGGFGIGRVGGHCSAPYFHDINFRDIDIIHNLGRDKEPDYNIKWNEGILQIAIQDFEQNYGVTGSDISNVLVEDLRVEDNRDEMLFDVGYWTDKATGSITDVTFRSVLTTHGTFRPSRIRARDDFLVRNIRFEGLYNRNNRIDSLAEGDIAVNGTVDNISFAPATRIIDSLRNFTKLHSKTDGWRIENRFIEQDGERGFLTRTSDTRQEVVYRLDSLNSFFVKTVLHTSFKNTLSFATSPDGSSWQQIEHIQSSGVDIRDGWELSWFWEKDSLPANANYLKIVIGGGTGQPGSLQIGRVDLYGDKIVNDVVSARHSHGMKLHQMPATTRGAFMRRGHLLLLPHELSWSVFTASGRLHAAGKSARIDLSHAPNGLYLVNIEHVLSPFRKMR